jgi:hypothetical protein
MPCYIGQRTQKALHPTEDCKYAIDRNNDPLAQKHILGSPYTVIGTSDGGGRPTARNGFYG